MEGTKTVEPKDVEYNQEKWNQMRRALEEGVETTDVSKKVETSSATASPPPKPPPGLISVDLPYESSLSITGRKVIRVDLSNTHISQERAEELGTKQDSQTFTMEQELQARIQGTVARKTTINVNFDDTKDNVRDFSVVYKGDPEEVVQEAAFGDIVLSLPATEFVNYNKQLFGIRTALRYKNFGVMAIGSRTKGTTETKRFTGTTSRQQIFINDTAYLRRKYFDLTFSTSPAMAGFVTLPINDTIGEIVLIEDNSTTPLAKDFVVSTPTGPATTVTIHMRQLSRGVDYSIDRLKGIITFNNTIAEDARVAVDFGVSPGQKLTDVTPAVGDQAVLIKDKTPETAGVSQEIKRFYSAGARNIVRDNGLGNFVLKVLDKNREKEILTGPPTSETDPNFQKYPDRINMQFETGIFELENPLPFGDVYAPNVNTGTPLQAVFSLEYQSILRTYTLRPNIVLQSETVMVDGRKVSRDLDYFIDYDIGIITFFNEDLIRESTTIEVTYEFAPFGGVLGETLVGTRGTFDIFKNQKFAGINIGNWSAGSTVLYNFAAKPNGPPDVRSTPASLLVIEGDTSVKGLKFGNFPLTSNFGVEAARSAENPDLFGRALIDSMEGVKQEDSSSLLKDSWNASANPFVTSTVTLTNYNTISDYRGRESDTSHLQWNDADVSATDTNGNSITKKALTVTYRLNTINSTTPEQASLINIISASGRDFSKKTTLEIEIQGAGDAGSGVNLVVDYGSFNEDADGDGILDSEDQIPLDGQLNLGEDIGYEFNGPGPDLSVTANTDNITFRQGGGNARLDTEDLNNDRILSTSDLPATFSPILDLAADAPQDVNGNTTSDLGFEGRRLFSIPLNISTLSGEEQARLTAVKQVRVTVRNNNGPTVGKSGTFFISKLAMVGNTWQPAEVTNSASTMTVRAINSIDDVGIYTSLRGNGSYEELYSGANQDPSAREQALDLDFSKGIVAQSTATTKNPYGAPRDFSKHDQFRFFLSRRTGCAADCGVFFLQAGSETDYQQAEIDIADIPTNPGWLLVNIKQVDLNKDGTPETWISDTAGVRVRYVGSQRSLTQVTQLKAGIINPNASATINNEVYLNEIHVAKPHERVGNAKRISFDSALTKWMDFGGSYRDVDRNWQTPTTAITNQDSKQTSAFLNFNRLAFLPMTFRTSKDETVTPSAFRANQNALVSFLEEGRVERRTNAATAKLIIPSFPLVDFAYDGEENKNNLTQRTEDNQTIRVGASYSPKIATFNLIPSKSLAFRPIPTSITFNHTSRVSKLLFPDAPKLNEFSISTAPFDSTNLTQYSQENEARLAFKPWDGFTFNPTYKLRTDTEKRQFRDDEKASLPAVGSLDGRITPRAQAQTITASGNLRLFKWLDPRYNYSFSGTETNGLPTQSNTTGYSLKTITRNSQGELSATVQMAQLLTKVRLVNSLNLNGSYKLEAGDTYNNMPEDFDWRSKLWVGSPLINSSATANVNAPQRTDATDRRTFRLNETWQPFSGFKVEHKRFKSFSSLSVTNNYLKSIEDAETTGTSRHTESVTFPDLILTMNDLEKVFNIKRVIENSRLVYKFNKRKTETRAVTRSVSQNWGTDYNFQLLKKYDVSTNFSITNSQDDNLITNQLASKTDTISYAVQTRIPWRVWAFTPRYERSKTDSRDAVQVTNDLLSEVYSLQIYGDITKPIGIRFGRKEVGLANRLILNSTLKWDKKRSTINPSTNYLDTYSASLSGDYTLSQNFRLAIGGNFSQEKHHPDFRKFDKLTFGLNSTLTIQF